MTQLVVADTVIKIEFSAGKEAQPLVSKINLVEWMLTDYYDRSYKW